MNLEISKRELLYVDRAIRDRLDYAIRRYNRESRLFNLSDIEMSESLGNHEADIRVLEVVHKRIVDLISDCNLTIP